MKKFLYFASFFILIGFFIHWSDQKWYRQWKGGTWFKIRAHGDAQNSVAPFWSRRQNNFYFDSSVVETEEY